MDSALMQTMYLIIYSKLFYLFVFVFGAYIGSFAGVCITRIPKGESIVFPRSRCVCGKIIPLWLNVPIIGWLALGGRASCCRRRIGVGYLSIELLVALLFTLLWHVTQSPLFIVGSILFVILVISSGIDFNTLMIPDLFTVGGAILGVICSCIFTYFGPREYPGLGILESVKGMLIGSSVLLWIAIISEIILKKETIGFGDVKLIGCIGAFSGTKCAIFSIFGGTLIGLFTIFPIWAIHCKIAKKRVGIGQELPFGPFLAVGAVAYWLFFRDMIDRSLVDMVMLLS